MIYRKTVPFSGGPVLLSGPTFSNIQSLLLSGYASKELEEKLGEKNLFFPGSWVIVGNKNQITHLSYQPKQSKLILILSGAAYLICSPLKEKSSSVIFNMRSGSSEALWVPESFAQGFYFLLPNTIGLIAATSLRNNSEKALDPLDPRYNIDLSALISHDKGQPKVSEIVKI